MRVKSIQTRNYRTLENIEINFSGKYNTISGKNNAGKSCVIRLLAALFDPGSEVPWSPINHGFNYKEDKTQWVKNEESISVKYTISLSSTDDSAFVSFIEKIAERPMQNEISEIQFLYTISEADDDVMEVRVDGEAVSEQAANEIGKRLRQSGALYLYNSTSRTDDYFIFVEKRAAFTSFRCRKQKKSELKPLVRSLRPS